MSCAYDADDCRVLSQALDKAWEIYVRTGRLTATDIEVVKAALSYALLDAADTGERNINRLAIAAVGRMAKYEGKLRYARSHGLQASPRQPAYPMPFRAQAYFDGDALFKMRAAFDAVVTRLDLKSDALRTSTLAEKIAALAAEGELDLEKLTERAAAAAAAAKSEVEFAADKP